MIKFLTLLLFSTPVYALKNFQEAKRALTKIHSDHPFTLYCHCSYKGKLVDLKSCGYKVYKNSKKAMKLEWEHVVPAHAFGHSFKEWREGNPKCMKRNKIIKGRKCAAKNPEFARMEGDLYNLFPEIGELNHLRSNYSMATIDKNDTRSITFGGCKAIVLKRKFEPMDQAKGIVARVYKYMDLTYPNRGIISGKNQKLFEAWDRAYPVTKEECARANRIKKIQGNVNPILDQVCLKIK